MRRITAKFARPGMVLCHAVYDNFSAKLLPSKTKLDEESINMLRGKAITEIFVEDWRMVDIPIGPLISPEFEGRAAKALLKLNTENIGRMNLSGKNIIDVTTAVKAMAEDLTLTRIGEVSVAGIGSQDDYKYLQPVKTALISMALGQALGYQITKLANLGIAALLKDIGYIVLPQEIIQKKETLTPEELTKIQQHPKQGYNLLRQNHHCSGEIATAVLQHHEQWNGNGYPQHLKAANISQFAQIITLADQYTAIISKRPGMKKKYLPHEAIEFIMSYSGECFNPELVELFVRRVPCYCCGLTVKLNTGEICIVSDAKLDFVGRPIVLVCVDPKEGVLKKPYEIDLSKAEFHRKLIVEILDYE
jgi:HD-GYP domain-containing protein (c-di-GMP phosphodiesterase class II)